MVVSLPSASVGGQTLPIWRVFWNLFGSSNQLLAALALLAVTVWLRRRGRSVWYTLGPTVFMLVMTLWSLAVTLQQHLARMQAGGVATAHHVEFAVALLLAAMAAWLAVEAVVMLRARPAATLAAAPAAGR